MCALCDAGIDPASKTGLLEQEIAEFVSCLAKHLAYLIPGETLASYQPRPQVTR